VSGGHLAAEAGELEADEALEGGGVLRLVWEAEGWGGSRIHSPRGGAGPPLRSYPCLPQGKNPEGGVAPPHTTPGV